MKINTIHYSDAFIKMFKELPKHIQKKAIISLEILQNTPFYNSLRLHKLQWKFLWFRSISITISYRIIFEQMENGDILLVSIGTHSIYEK